MILAAFSDGATKTSSDSDCSDAAAGAVAHAAAAAAAADAAPAAPAYHAAAEAPRRRWRPAAEAAGRRAAGRPRTSGEEKCFFHVSYMTMIAYESTTKHL